MISERLAQFRDAKGLKQKEFAELLDIKQGTYSRYERGTSDLSTELLKKISIKMDLNINWLITGKGEMFITPNQKSAFPKEETINIEYKYLPEVYAAAGVGYYNENESYELISIDKKIADHIGLSPSIELIRVYGDSMEPKYKSGDFLFIDKSDKKFTKEGIYTILFEGVLMVKYLQKILGGIRIHSLNSEYKDIDVIFDTCPDGTLIIVGIVKGAVTFN